MRGVKRSSYHDWILNRLHSLGINRRLWQVIIFICTGLPLAQVDNAYNFSHIFTNYLPPIHALLWQFSLNIAVHSSLLICTASQHPGGRSLPPIFGSFDTSQVPRLKSSYQIQSEEIMKPIHRQVPLPHSESSPSKTSGLRNWQVNLFHIVRGQYQQCTMCCLGSMFSFQPNKLRHILKFLPKTT